MKRPSRLFAVVLAAAVANGCHRKEKIPVASGADSGAPAAPAEHALYSLRTAASEGPAAAEVKAAATAELAASNPQYEAWFRKYHLDLTDPNMLDADPDGDGYTNREEFLAGTDPLDPKSHPTTHAGVHKTIQLKDYNQVDEPFILKSIEGETARIERRDEGAPKLEEVRAGQTLHGSALRVDKVETRKGVDKNGNEVDLSRVVLKNPATHAETNLVKDQATRSPETTAVLTSADGANTARVKRGQTFTWPGEGGGTYTVLDLRPNQAILKDTETGKVWTVEKR